MLVRRPGARAFAVEGGSSWVSNSHLSPRTVSSSAPIAPIRAGRPRAASSSSRKSSASIITSARCATGSPAKATPRWRRRCSIASSRISRCGYTPDEIANARKFVANPDWGAMMRDIQAAIDDAQEGRPGRHHRLLHGRHDRVPRRRQAQRPVRRGRLLRRPDREERRREAEDPDAAALRREGCLDPDDRRRDRSSRSAAAIAKSTSIPTPSTASIATSAAASTKEPPRSPGGARSRSCRSTCRSRGQMTDDG